jgi:hypothetical protein
MKVQELIEALSAFDGGLEVLCYTEAEDFVPAGHIFRLLDLTGVDATDGEKGRGDDRVPTLKLGRSAMSTRIVLLDVTPEF